jgi:tetratricopeptide (TPR) repeat protein
MQRSIVLMVAVACRSSSATDPPPSKTTAPAPASAADAQSAAAPEATPKQLAQAHAHMKAGWAAQKAKKWSDATTEFEAALAIVDGDARALAELGWSAMNAGDLAKAKKADEAAVRAAIEPKVKAAGLYNLGLVQLRLDDQAGAKKSLEASLALRPNHAVEDALAKLGASPAEQAVFCEPGKRPCDCAMAAFTGDAPESCAVSTELKPPVATFHVYTVKGGPDREDYLLDEHDQLVAVIGGAVAQRRLITSIHLDKTAVSTVGGHQVLRLDLTDHETNHDLNETGYEDEDLTTKHATYCAVGDAKTPTKCIDVPTEITHILEQSNISADLKVGATTTKQRRQATFEVALGDDGTVTVKLAKGTLGDDLDPNTVGPHKLW